MDAINAEPITESAAPAPEAPAPAPSASATVKAPSPGQIILAALEETLSALLPADRKAYFHTHQAPADVAALNLLCQKVDSLRNPTERKAFFLAHPELEIRYSANNFKTATS